MTRNPVITLVDETGTVITFSATATVAAAAATTAADGSTTAVTSVGYNAGGPSSGLYDRTRNLQGKGLAANTLSQDISLGQPLVLLNSGSVPAVGQMITLLGGTAECGYVSAVNGQIVTLSANLANNHLSGTAVQWDGFAVAGAAASGFGPTGIGMVAEAVYDPVTALYYVPQGAKGTPFVSDGGRAATAIAAGVATDTVIKASPGRLCRILVTTAGANALLVYDNATAGSGTVIGALAAAAAAGIYDFQMPASAGITVKGNAANPAVTISYL